MDSNIFNATFWITISGVISGLVIALIAAINKSKCKNIECCCGLFKCIRDTEAEVELEEHRIDHGIPPDTPTNLRRLQT
jgi:hypothetical protein